MFALLAVGVLNTVFSLYYYLRVVKVLVLDAEKKEQPAPVIPFFSWVGAYFVMLTLPVVLLFFISDGLTRVAADAVQSLLLS